MVKSIGEYRREAALKGMRNVETETACKVCGDLWRSVSTGRCVVCRSKEQRRYREKQKCG